MASPEPYRDDDRVPRWLDREELAQVVELARLEAAATGFDPAVAGAKAARGYYFSERRRLGRMKAASVVFQGDPSHDQPRKMDATLGWLDEASKVRSLRPADRGTEGQRRRFVRNQVIFAAALAGFSQRSLAEVFEMPHSRIAAIVAQMRERTGIEG